jgi:3-hydroxyacyl-CoA dehydrogenase/3-hydroxy-2-methylbutyryl-CoA dehydrogenase
MQLANSVVAVTGGASGLGEAVARRSIDQGAAGVAILDVNDDAAASLASELGENALALHCDVRNGNNVTDAMTAITEKFGRLNLAVACAGVGWAERTLAKDSTPADLDAYRRVIEINLIGTYDFARQAASVMSRNEPDGSGERGAIVMTASLAAFDGQIGQSAYSASKGGIVGMTLPMARDLAPVGVRVMTIAPGLMDTPIYDPVGGAELKERLTAVTVFPKRLGAADEYAHLVQSIAENSYLNGETIRHDAATRLPPR